MVTTREAGFRPPKRPKTNLTDKYFPDFFLNVPKDDGGNIETDERTVIPVWAKPKWIVVHPYRVGYGQKANWKNYFACNGEYDSSGELIGDTCGACNIRPQLDKDAPFGFAKWILVMPIIDRTGYVNKNGKNNIKDTCRWLTIPDDRALWFNKLIAKKGGSIKGLVFTVERTEKGNKIGNWEPTGKKVSVLKLVKKLGEKAEPLKLEDWFPALEPDKMKAHVKALMRGMADSEEIDVLMAGEDPEEVTTYDDEDEDIDDAEETEEEEDSDEEDEDSEEGDDEEVDLEDESEEDEDEDEDEDEEEAADDEEEAAEIEIFECEDGTFEDADGNKVDEYGNPVKPKKAVKKKVAKKKPTAGAKKKGYKIPF